MRAYTSTYIGKAHAPTSFSISISFEIDELTKEQNYEVLKKALLIKSKRMITLIHSIPEQQKTSNIEKYNLIDFVQEYANERKPQTGKEGMRKIWKHHQLDNI